MTEGFEFIYNMLVLAGFCGFLFGVIISIGTAEYSKFIIEKKEKKKKLMCKRCSNIYDIEL